MNETRRDGQKAFVKISAAYPELISCSLAHLVIYLGIQFRVLFVVVVGKGVTSSRRSKTPFKVRLLIVRSQRKLSVAQASKRHQAFQIRRDGKRKATNDEC
jgi:hypothetical protein